MPEKFKWNYTETKPAPLMDRGTAGYTSLFHLPNITEADKVPKTSDGRGYRDKNPYYEYLTDKQKEEWRLGQNRRKNFDTYYNKYLGSDPLYRSNEQKWLAEYLAFIESRWNPQAQNEKTNAKGLFQIMPQYWGSRNSKNIQDQFLRYKEMMDANSQGIIRLMKSGKVQKSSIAMSRLRNGYDANAMRAIAWLSGLGGLEGFLLKGQNRSDGGTTQAQYAAAIVQRNLNNPKNKREQQQYAYAQDPDEENTEQEDLSQYEDQEPAYYYDDEDDYYTPQQQEYSPPEDFDFNNYQSDTEQVGNEEQPYNPLQDIQMPEPEEPSSLFQSQNNYTGGEDDYDYDNPKDFQSYLKQKQALEEQEQAMRIEELNAPTALNQYVEQLLEEPNKQFTKPVVQPLQAAMGGHLFGNGGDGRTTLPHVGDSWRDTETGESGTVVGYAPDVPYMGDDGKLYPTTSPVVKYDSGETLFGVTPQYTLPEITATGHLRTPANDLDNMVANMLTAGLASTEQNAADKLKNGNYIGGGLEAISPFLFAPNPVGNVTRGLYGGYHLFNNEGLPKTYKEFAQGNYWNGVKSLAGDALNALLLGQGTYGTADDALNLAAKLGNADAKSIQFARALNKDIKNTNPSINPRSIASNFEIDPISGNLDVDYTLFDAFGDKMGQARMAGVDDGTRYVNGIKSTNIGKGVTEDIYNTAVLDTNRGLRSGVTTLYSPKKTLAVTRGKMGYIPEGFNEEGQPVTRIISPSSKSLPQRVNGNHYREISLEPTIQYNELTGEFKAVPSNTLAEEPLTISWKDATTPQNGISKTISESAKPIDEAKYARDTSSYIAPYQNLMTIQKNAEAGRQDLISDITSTWRKDRLRKAGISEENIDKIVARQKALAKEAYFDFSKSEKEIGGIGITAPRSPNIQVLPDGTIVKDYNTGLDISIAKDVGKDARKTGFHEAGHYSMGNAVGIHPGSQVTDYSNPFFSPVAYDAPGERLISRGDAWQHQLIDYNQSLLPKKDPYYESIMGMKYDVRKDPAKVKKTLMDNGISETKADQIIKDIKEADYMWDTQEQDRHLKEFFHYEIKPLLNNPNDAAEIEKVLTEHPEIIERHSFIKQLMNKLRPGSIKEYSKVLAGMLSTLPGIYMINNSQDNTNSHAKGGPLVQFANKFGDGGVQYNAWDDIILNSDGNIMIGGEPYTIRALSKDEYPEGLVVTGHKKSPAETWMYHDAPINREGTLLQDIGYRLMTSKQKEDRSLLDVMEQTFNSLRGLPNHPQYTGNLYWNGETSYPNLNRNLHHLSMYGNNGQFEPDTIKYGFDYSDYLNKTYTGLQVPTFKGSIYNTGDNFDLVSPTDYKDLVEYLAETNKGTYTHPEAGEDIPLFENYENREFGIDDTGSNRVGLFYDPEARQYKVRASDIIDYGGAGKTGYSGRWGTLAGIQGNLLSKHLTYPALILNQEIPIKFSNNEADYKEGNSLEPVLEQIVADYNILRKSSLPYADYEYPFLYGNLQVTPQGSSFDMTRRADVPLWNRYIQQQAMQQDYSNNPYSKKFNTGFSIR